MRTYVIRNLIFVRLSFPAATFPAAATAPRRTRGDLFKHVDADYYGYRDEDDGILVALEKEAEAEGVMRGGIYFLHAGEVALSALLLSGNRRHVDGHFPPFFSQLQTLHSLSQPLSARQRPGKRSSPLARSRSGLAPPARRPKTTSKRRWRLTWLRSSARRSARRAWYALGVVCVVILSLLSPIAPLPNFPLLGRGRSDGY